MIKFQFENSIIEIQNHENWFDKIILIINMIKNEMFKQKITENDKQIPSIIRSQK